MTHEKKKENFFFFNRAAKLCNQMWYQPLPVIYFNFVVLCNIIMIMVFYLFLLLYLLETVVWSSVSLCIPMWSFVWFLSGFLTQWKCVMFTCTEFEKKIVVALISLVVGFVCPSKAPPIVLSWPHNVLFNLNQIWMEENMDMLNLNHSKGLCTLLCINLRIFI